MPNFMVYSGMTDRLRLMGPIVGGTIDFLHDVVFNTQGLPGSPEEKKRNLEDRARPILQRAIENVIPLSDFPIDDPVITNPEWYVKYDGQGWPDYIEGINLISRTDTIDIRINNLDPLDYIVWIGDARVHKLPPINWWS